MNRIITSILALTVVWVSGIADAQDSAVINESMYKNLRYRLIGPFRASRTVGAVGIPSQPNVFFVGINNGGVWKSDDYGRTWNPIFDDAPTGSVGDLGVSISNPNILYVGTGEGLHRPDLAVGDGIFKSIDGGTSWVHVGLIDVQQVARLIVHPDNPDIVFVAGLGHPYGPNDERGVFRTIDGGATWDKVLYIDQNTGAAQVEFDPTNPDILYADLWEHREGPWENAKFSGPNSGLYKSADGGSTWRRLEEGLPASDDGLGRVGVGISPSDPNRIYATVDAREKGGIYRSDDAGESWRLIHTDRRLWGRGGDFAEIRVHPHDPDIVFVGNIASYRSDDGGATWMSIKGAPGGDDYHRIWINPIDPDIMLFATDQGATVTVNGGRTWSSWYNQPTAQLYHVSTDNQFPYWVYGGQQESGAIRISSRGDGGQISFRDWYGIGADEYPYVAPDPLDSNIVYGGRIVKHDIRTGQSQNVAPEALRSGNIRILRTMPLMFHPADPTMLMFATNVLWKSHTGGYDWQIISPDLSDPLPDVPESIGTFITPELSTMPRRGVIYAVDGSSNNPDVIWAGTDDGLVHVTRDGGDTWSNVAPPQLRAWDKVSQIDASHFEDGTAYIAVNAIRRDDMRPLIFRTQDWGQTWTKIVSGLPENGPVNVVREDPVQPGLLFAGTERSVYFSPDDGDSWHPLRLNLPPSSMRDLVIHEADLVVGTHGRSIWILDNISILRALAAGFSTGPTLADPPTATRVRWNMFTDTPLPPEEPTGENPPDGAILDYYLPKDARNVTLEIRFGADPTTSRIIRRYTSDDIPVEIDSTTLPHPTYWIRPEQSLGKTQGHHRFIWDLRYAPPAGTRRQFSIAAVQHRTPSGPRGPFVHPETYMVRLTVDGVSVDKELSVRLDPRVSVDSSAIQKQTEYSLRAYDSYHRLLEIREAIDRALLAPNVSARSRSQLQSLRGSGLPGDPDITYGSIYAEPAETETVVGLQHKFLFMLNLLQGADAMPTSQAIEAVHRLEKSAEVLVERWNQINR